jgi:crossover junction endodeoxyribonuclease RuvC
MVRVLAVDPGLTRCGVGVIDGDSSRRVALVAAGVIRTAPELPIEKRLWAIQVELMQYFVEFRPDRVAVERVFAQNNVRTAIGTAQASAVVMLCAAGQDLPVTSHTPSEVKAAVTGNGRADKRQVGAMVKRLLKLDHEPKPADVADALALGICHVWRTPFATRLTSAAAGRAL